MGINDDYWEVHPEQALIYDDEFVNSQDSSKVMWCIYMLTDPRSDISMEPDHNKRLDFIRKYYDFDPDDYIDIIEQYMNMVPEIEIVYNELLLDLKSTAKVVSDTVINNVKDAKTKIDALANAHKIIDELVKRKKLIVASRSTEASAAAARGGYTPSKIEQGLIGPNAKR